MNVLHAIAELSAARLLNSLAEGLFVAVLAWVLLRVLTRQNSGTRFAIWFSALVIIAAMPLVGMRSAAGAASLRPEIAIASSWAVYIFAGWAAIAFCALARVAIGLWNVRKLRLSCVLLDQSLTTRNTNEYTGLTTEDREEHRGLIESTTTRSARPVCVAVSERVQVPTAVGFFRPMVILPKWTVEELSAEELRAVVLHEVAHLRRWDDWSNLAQKLIRALFFFHPAVWWIDNRLTLEREMACDDLVLAETSDPRSYAECLVSLAEKNFFRRGLAMAQAAVGQVRHMSLRVARILDPNRRGATRVWKPAVALLAVLSAAGVIREAHTSPLVGFESSTPTTSTSITSADNGVHVPRAMIVEAGLHSSPAKHVATLANTLPRVAKAKQPVKRRSVPAMIAAGAASVAPKVVQAKVPLPAPHTFVVVETNYYQGTQGVFWTMTVWQIQAGSAHEKQAVKQVIPRST